MFLGRGGTTGRSVEEINEILSAAKLDRKDLLPVSQEIAFDGKFSSTEYRLVEMDKEVAENIRVGNRLVFRGDANESAVLCTRDSTFEIKEAETSNSLLILEELAFPEQARRASGSTDSSTGSKSPDSVSNLPVISLDSLNELQSDDNDIHEVLLRTIRDIAHSYLELKKMTPNLSKIRNILAPSTYKGESSEVDIENDAFMTLENLLDMVPASVGEIEDYLEANRIMYARGHLRQIDDDYLFRVLSLVIGCVDENSWENGKIQRSVVIKTLSSLEPEFVLENIFDWFFYPTTDSENVDLFTMKEYEICRFYGEVLLKPVGRFNLMEFMKVWQESVPEGLKVDIKQLEGLAVSNTQCTPAVVWYFPEYNLPDLATDRFVVLFEAKPKWKLEEITPYLRNVSSSSQNAGVLLTKFARVSNVNGVKYYSSKHSK